MNDEAKMHLRNLYIKNSRLPSKYLQDTDLIVPTIDRSSYKNLTTVKNKIVLFTKSHKNLLLSSSSVGNGKTTWSVKIILHYIDEYACNYAFINNTPVLFINVPEFLMKKKLSINDSSILEEVCQIEKSIFTARIVVFDDIATKTASDYDKELLYVYINYRISNLLTNIYTTNVSKDQLEDELGARLSSRIVGESYCVELNGPGMRGYSK